LNTERLLQPKLELRKSVEKLEKLITLAAKVKDDYETVNRFC